MTVPAIAVRDSCSDRPYCGAPFDMGQTTRMTDIYYNDPRVGPGFLIRGNVSETFAKCAAGGAGAYYNSSTEAIMAESGATNETAYWCGGVMKEGDCGRLQDQFDNGDILGNRCTSAGSALRSKWWLALAVSVALAGVSL